MHRIDNASASPVLDAPTAPGVNPDHFFTKGVPGTSTPPTVVDQEWLNMVMEELVAVAVAGGAALNKADRTQVRAGITALIAASAGSVKWKATAKAGTTADIVLSGEQTVDGIALVSGDICLAKDQTAPEENGLYVVAAGAWARHGTMDAWDEIPSAAVIVEQGTVGADTSWICTADQGGVLDTTAITWAAFGGGDVQAANNGTEFIEATFKANLNMEAGVDYQAYDADTTKNDVANTFTQIQKFAAGSAAAPSMTFGADTDTGISNPSANTLAISTAGIERLRLTSGGHTYTSDSHTWISSGGAQRMALNGAGKLYHGSTAYGAHVSIGHTDNTIAALHVEGGTATSMRGVFFNETNTGYASEVQRISVNKTGATDFNFLSTYSGNGGDREHVFFGDGTSNADGAWSSTGADYAEYFEWLDGNPNNESRHGMSVVLDGGKIRECLVGEDPFGVVSARPTIIGDNDIGRWKQKYLMDDYGAYILGNVDRVMWKTGSGSDDGQQLHSYPVSIAPEIPADATDVKYYTEQNVKQLNPLWDPSIPYIPRRDRPEWAAIGTMGKLPVTKGQVIGTNWEKLEDVSATVERWWVTP